MQNSVMLTTQKLLRRTPNEYLRRGKRKTCQRRSDQHIWLHWGREKRPKWILLDLMPVKWWSFCIDILQQLLTIFFAEHCFSFYCRTVLCTCHYRMHGHEFDCERNQWYTYRRACTTRRCDVKHAVEELSMRKTSGMMRLDNFVLFGSNPK